MMRSLYSGVAGLKNHQTRMDVVGNNIANVNTVGYKAGRTTFQDMLSQSIKGASSPTGTTGGVNPLQIGLGMGVASVDNIFTTGSLQATGKNTDLAIDGDGFFMVKSGLDTYYTRAGNFDFDSLGNYVIPGTGLQVMGWRADSTGKIDTSTEPIPLNIPLNDTMPPRATTLIDFRGTLNSSTKVGDTVPTSIAVYDSMGVEHQAKVLFTKVNDYNWNVEFDVEGATGGPYTGGIVFDENGKYLYTSPAVSSTSDTVKNVFSLTDPNINNPSVTVDRSTPGVSITTTVTNTNIRDVCVGSDGNLYSHDTTTGIYKDIVSGLEYIQDPLYPANYFLPVQYTVGGETLTYDAATDSYKDNSGVERVIRDPKYSYNFLPVEYTVGGETLTYDIATDSYKNASDQEKLLRDPRYSNYFLPMEFTVGLETFTYNTTTGNYDNASGVEKYIQDPKVSYYYLPMEYTVGVETFTYDAASDSYKDASDAVKYVRNPRSSTSFLPMEYTAGGETLTYDTVNRVYKNSSGVVRYVQNPRSTTSFLPMEYTAGGVTFTYDTLNDKYTDNTPSMMEYYPNTRTTNVFLPREYTAGGVTFTYNTGNSRYTDTSSGSGMEYIQHPTMTGSFIPMSFNYVENSISYTFVYNTSDSSYYVNGNKYIYNYSNGQFTCSNPTPPPSITTIMPPTQNPPQQYPPQIVPTRTPQRDLQVWISSTPNRLYSTMTTDGYIYDVVTTVDTAISSDSIQGIFTPANGAADMTITLDLKTLTQYGVDSDAKAIDQDGYTAGTLDRASLNVDASGIIFGKFSNSQLMNLGQVALAIFTNPGGLTKVGSSLFAQSNNSGTARVGIPGQGSYGSIKPSNLEMSNVDLSEEFTTMITTQRGFQGNSRIITTSDTMLEELVNLKR